MNKEFEMKHIRAIAAMVLFAVAGGLCTPSHADGKSKVKRIWVKAPITVEADGRAVIGEITGAKEALTNAVRELLSKARYVPARRNGVAVASSTLARAEIVLTPAEGDRFAIGLGDIHLGTHAKKAFPPRYPDDMARHNKSGSVELRLRVGADGKVTVLRTVAATNSAFEEAAIKSVKGWRMEPQLIEGIPAEVEVSQPFLFRAHPKAAEVEPVFQCAWDESRPRWENQRVGCLDRWEVWLSF